jgi:serine/threonine-protein kinase
MTPVKVLQLEDKPGDGRVDLWALGLILYEAIVGRPAFEAGSQAGLIAAILERPLEIPQDANLPPALKRLMEALTRKNPAERLQSAHDLLQQLTWIADDLAAPQRGLAVAGPGSQTGSSRRRPATKAIAGRSFCPTGSISSSWAGTPAG